MGKLGCAFVAGGATILLLFPAGAATAQTYPCHIEQELPNGWRTCVRDPEWHLGVFCWNMERYTGLEEQTGINWCPWERLS